MSTCEPLNFEPAIPIKGAAILNPKGTLAICTLWTPPEFVRKHFLEGFPGAEHVAIVGGLYGGGLKNMLRNLLYNPQIDTVMLFGKDFSGAGEHLRQFFAGEVAWTGLRRSYIFADGSRKALETLAIVGGETTYVLDGLVTPDDFAAPPTIVHVPFEPGFLPEFLRNYRPRPAMSPPERVWVELPTPEVGTFPSDPNAHMIVADTIIEGWEQLLFRLHRFGRPMEFRNGKTRRELLNMKVVIRTPGDCDQATLKRFNLSPGEIAAYQAALLSPEPGMGVYAYGHRMRAHFGRDLLARMAEDLAQAGDSRRDFITLWDNTLDPDGTSAPCLVSLFFRKVHWRVHLTATFRAHNAARAWPLNCFGLSKVLGEVCSLANAMPGRTQRAALEPGTLTVLSHSISLDPADLDHVQGLIDGYARRRVPFTLDPHGYLSFSIDPETWEIVVQHHAPDDEFLGEYRGKTPRDLARQLCRDAVLSDIGHALHIGGQLEKAAAYLKIIGPAPAPDTAYPKLFGRRGDDGGV